MTKSVVSTNKSAEVSKKSSAKAPTSFAKADAKDAGLAVEARFFNKA